MVWSILSSQSPPSVGSEAWAELPIVGDPSHIAYAFRLVVASSTPSSWNTGGYWGLYQGDGAVKSIGRTYEIPLIGRGSSQSLRFIGVQEVDFWPAGVTSFGVAYYVHKWIEASATELWVQT